MTKQEETEVRNATVEIPMANGLAVVTTGCPDITHIGDIKLFPIDTRFTSQDTRVYRYIVDDKGYHWIGEELWQIIPGR